MPAGHCNKAVCRVAVCSLFSTFASSAIALKISEKTNTSLDEGGKSLQRVRPHLAMMVGAKSGNVGYAVRSAAGQRFDVMSFKIDSSVSELKSNLTAEFAFSIRSYQSVGSDCSASFSDYYLG